MKGWTRNLLLLGVLAAALFVLYVSGILLPTHRMQIMADGAGQVSPELGIHRYRAGQDVELQAVPASDHEFVRWHVNAGRLGDEHSPHTVLTMPERDVFLTAEFVRKQHTVTFWDWDDNVLQVQDVDHGSAAAAPELPPREGYLFLGWEPAFDEVTEPLEVAPRFEHRVYEVTFLGWDGRMIETQMVPHGAAAAEPQAPERPNHQFIGWSVPLDEISSRLLVTAQYEPDEHRVEFVDWDGTSLATQWVEHGQAAAPPPAPARDGYSFVGWSAAVESIQGQTLVRAVYAVAEAPLAEVEGPLAEAEVPLAEAEDSEQQMEDADAEPLVEMEPELWEDVSEDPDWESLPSDEPVADDPAEPMDPGPVVVVEPEAAVTETEVPADDNGVEVDSDATVEPTDDVSPAAESAHSVLFLSTPSLAGIEITIQAVDEAQQQIVRTGSTGLATAELTRGEYTFTATLDGYQQQSGRFQVQSAGRIVELVLTEVQAAITGVVRDALTGEPLERAGVVLYAGDSTRIMDMLSATTSNTRGEYSLADVQPGRYTMRVRVIGYETKVLFPVDVERGEQQIIEVFLEADDF